MVDVELGVDNQVRYAEERRDGVPENTARPFSEFREVVSSFLGGKRWGEEQHDVFLSLFERSGIGLAIIDPALRLMSVNSVLTSRCDRGVGELRGRDIVEFLHPSVQQPVLRQFGRLVRGEPVRLVSHSVALCLRDGVVSGKVTAFPVEDGEGRIRMIVAQFTPEETANGHQALVGAEWKLAPLSAKVLEGVAAGDPTVRLAAKLFLSRQGIEYHVGMLLRQFKVPNRTALAAKAYSLGMFSIGSWPPRVHPDHIRSEEQETERSRGGAGVRTRRP